MSLTKDIDVTLIYNGEIISVKIPVNKKCKFIAKSIEILEEENFHIKYSHVYADHVSTKNYYSQSDYKKYRQLWEECKSL